jgi:hypothetical protein
MAATDYRKLIDGLRDADGDSVYASVETIAVNADESPLIGLEIHLAHRTGPLVALRLDEGDAGAIFDALGNALRTIATGVRA